MNCSELQEGVKGERYVVKRPKALKWFHNGRLVKETDEERQAGRFELFLDLLYVAIVANFSDDLAEHPDGRHLAKYMLIFAPAWHIWADLREIMNSYYTDDIVQRLVILWVMALLVLYANNARLVDEDISALRTAAGAYMVARLTTMCVFLICSFASYQHRTQARILAGFMFIGLFLAIPLFFEEISIGAKMAVVMALFAFLVGWETIGGLLKGASMFELWNNRHAPPGGQRDRPVNYRCNVDRMLILQYPIYKITCKPVSI